MVAAAAEHGMRLIGPNCLGLISPVNRLVLCSSPALDVEHLIEAPIGFVSQSGALMGTLFDRSHGMGIGFSHCISVGNQADLELTDFIEYRMTEPKSSAATWRASSRRSASSNSRAARASLASPG